MEMSHGSGDYNLKFRLGSELHELLITDKKPVGTAAHEVKIGAKTCYIIDRTAQKNDSDISVLELFKKIIAGKNVLSDSTIKESLKELHTIKKLPITDFKITIKTELTSKILSAMEAGDHAAYMRILLKMTPQEASSLKQQLVAYMEQYRNVLSQFVTERKLLADDPVRCSFKPMSEHGQHFYSFTKEIVEDPNMSNPFEEELTEDVPQEVSSNPAIRVERCFADDVTVYEIKDGTNLAGYAVVLKNSCKCNDLQSFNAVRARMGDNNLYNVAWIETEKRHQGKGLAYLLLHTVLADKIKNRQASVSLTDASGFAGTKLYQHVHEYNKDGVVHEEFYKITSSGDYSYHHISHKPLQ